MHRRGGVKMLTDGWGAGADARRWFKLSSRTQLSSSIKEPAFPSRARAWRAPDLPRSEHRGRLTAGRVLRLALALLALFEAIAVAVHFEDVDVVCQPVEQRAGQPLGPEHAGPFVE